VPRCLITFTGNPTYTSKAAATAKAGRLLAAAPSVGVDLFDLERVRRRLVDHEAEYERTPEPLRRRKLVQLMDEEIGTLALAYKKLEGSGLRGPAMT